MRAVAVAVPGRRAVVGGGATWADVDQATQAAGLAVTGGLVSTTGVGGFTLGGGVGWLMRRYGLASDNLVGAEVVNADGSIVRASESENADLLWGLRGGGGNFGVVTSFEFRLFPVGPTILGGPIFYPGAQTADVLRAWRTATTAMPDDLTTLVSLGSAVVVVVVASISGADADAVARVIQGLVTGVGYFLASAITRAPECRLRRHGARPAVRRCHGRPRDRSS